MILLVRSEGAKTRTQCLADSDAGTAIDSTGAVLVVRGFGVASLELISWDGAVPRSA
jgi:hypothetical protein